MQAKDIMSEDVLVLSPEDTVSKFISLMEKHHIHEVPVVSNKKLVGIVHYKNISERGVIDPSAAKIKAFVMNSQTASPEDDIEKVAEILFKTSLRSLPVVENNVLVGILSVFDVVEALAKSKDFRQTQAEAIMSVAEIIGEKDDIGKARVLMREKNVSRLPVVDSSGKLKGVITVFNLLRAIKPRERMGWYSMAAEKLTTMNIPVSTVMNSNPVTADEKTSVTEIASLIKKYKTSGVVIAVDACPVGVVTLRDVLEFYFAGLTKKGVYVQITGLKEEDEFVLSTVDRMIRDSMQKLSFMKPQFFVIHIKKYKKEGEKAKHSVRSRFMTGSGLFISKGFAWDLRDAVAMALDNLERIVKKEKVRKKDVSIKKRREETFTRKTF